MRPGFLSQCLTAPAYAKPNSRMEPPRGFVLVPSILLVLAVGQSKEAKQGKKQPPIWPLTRVRVHPARDAGTTTL
jgi:hypothetical protein